MKLKVELTNEDGIPFGLLAEDKVDVIFPYHEGTLFVPLTMLEETSSFDVELNQFQVDGFKEGENQTFWAKLKRGNKIYTFEFTKALTIRADGERKTIRYAGPSGGKNE